MKKCTATSIEEALEHLEKMKKWKPFEYSGINYIVDMKYGGFKFLCSKPKKLKPNEVLYRIENENYKISKCDL